MWNKIIFYIRKLAWKLIFHGDIYCKMCYCYVWDKKRCAFCREFDSEEKEMALEVDIQMQPSHYQGIGFTNEQKNFLESVLPHKNVE